jgi:hypothetical protein
MIEEVRFCLKTDEAPSLTCAVAMAIEFAGGGDAERPVAH